MMCDVRKIHPEYAVALFKTMTDNECSKIWFDSENHDVHLTFKNEDGQELRCRLYDNRVAYMEFYTGQDNIRFDGSIEDEECINKLKRLSEAGLSDHVTSYIDLKGYL